MVTVSGEDVAVRIVENKHGEATVYLNGGEVQPWVTSSFVPSSPS